MESAPQQPDRPAAEPESRLGRKLAIVAVVGALLVAAYVFAVSVLPRWWSQQVGDQVDGDLTTGGLLGFMYGFLATLLPLLALGLVWRFRRHSLWAWIVGAALALVLATPNLVTPGRHGRRGRRGCPARPLRRLCGGVALARRSEGAGGSREPRDAAAGASRGADSSERARRLIPARLGLTVEGHEGHADGSTRGRTVEPMQS
jgi:hypothetical protein